MIITVKARKVGKAELGEVAKDYRVLSMPYMVLRSKTCELSTVGSHPSG
ncbi:hypothetical protein [Sinimarinibacterium sp. NLF-5-8]|nr:hypothetical protein [Sinimarinibacterium sp. NLF-5-8]QHS09158.1 hypothetical protein GT972_02630 [Sinimarinibacterium sp. NLF-5-8]